MPNVFIKGGFRFFFFSNEGHEPIHIHVEKSEKYSKFWMEPLSLAYNYRFNTPELNKIKSIIEKHSDKIKEAWNVYFNRH